MSYCGALPTAESESSLLVDACLARVRQDAGLDDDPVLPPLHALIGSRAPGSVRRFVVGQSAHNLPSAEAIVKSVAVAATSVAPPALPAGANEERKRTTTVLTPEAHAKKTLAQRMRWPVFLCGFVAGTFGGIAVMKSPVGQRPAVQHVMKSARHHLSAAYTTATSKARIPNH